MNEGTMNATHTPDTLKATKSEARDIGWLYLVEGPTGKVFAAIPSSLDIDEARRYAELFAAAPALLAALECMVAVHCDGWATTGTVRKAEAEAIARAAIAAAGKDGV
jgi:hypothetical protein